MQIQQKNIREGNFYFIGTILINLDAKIKGLRKLMSQTKRKLFENYDK